jgi:Zn-dependent metalloprotease
MTYGDGNNFDVLTSLDVCGHEIGHAVCSNTDLAYQNQSGAMNEGYSDVWGACVEHLEEQVHLMENLIQVFG